MNMFIMKLVTVYIIYLSYLYYICCFQIKTKICYRKSWSFTYFYLYYSILHCNYEYSASDVLTVKDILLRKQGCKCFLDIVVGLFESCVVSAVACFIFHIFKFNLVALVCKRNAERDVF